MAYFSARTDPALYRCACDRSDCTAPEPHATLVQMLNLMRAVYGKPIAVTSGPRCPYQNALVGGQDDSAHLTGRAADLRCRTSAERWDMLEAAKQAGFRRIELTPSHVHVDMADDAHHPSDVLMVAGR